MANFDFAASVFLERGLPLKAIRHRALVISTNQYPFSGQ